jgi:glycosyltransferase involved in cell wall biosynthesis
MKRVLIEMEKLKNPNSGLGQFCLNIGEQFQLLNTKNLQLDFYLPSFQKNIFGEEFNYIRHTPLHKLLPLSSSEHDVWHCLQQDSHYLPNNKSTKLILTIHDLNFLEKYKGAKQRRKLNSLQKRVNKATAITVISKFTEAMVRENLQLNNTPIHVIYNGNSLKTMADAPVPDFINRNSVTDFIFSIGIISPRKNFHTLLPLLQSNKQLQLIIAGDTNSDYAKQLVKTAEITGVGKQIHFPGTIDDATKYWLYKNCKAFVFPSLTEGFGLPVVEAMSLGKPVFLSNLTSLPEIGGTEAFYWKNFDPEYMVEIFEKGLREFALDNEKAQRSIIWAKQFSWENAAKAYLNLYENV